MYKISLKFIELLEFYEKPIVPFKFKTICDIILFRISVLSVMVCQIPTIFCNS